MKRSVFSIKNHGHTDDFHSKKSTDESVKAEQDNFKGSVADEKVIASNDDAGNSMLDVASISSPLIKESKKKLEFNSKKNDGEKKLRTQGNNKKNSLLKERLKSKKKAPST